MKIAIDGPAGSGKSTVAKRLSLHRGIPYLDTGALYRAFGYVSILKNTDVQNLQEVLSLFDEDIKVITDVGKTTVYYKGVVIDEKLRGEEVGRQKP